MTPLTEKIFGESSSRIKVDLMLLSKPDQGFMDSVDANISRLAIDPVIVAASEHIDTASDALQTGAGAAETSGPCVQPLEQILQGIVKVMDGISEVIMRLQLYHLMSN